MFITLFAIATSFLMLFFDTIRLNFEPYQLTVLGLVAGTALFFAALILNITVLIPLQYLEQQLIPNVMEIIRRDIPLRLGRFYLFLFFLISPLCAPILLQMTPSHQHLFFLIWIVLLGLGLDILMGNWKRYVDFLTPSFVVRYISKQAEHAIQNDKQAAFLNDLNSLAEISIRSVETSKLALSTQTLQTFPPLLKVYFDSIKSISHPTPTIAKQEEFGGGDASNYIVFYLMQRLEMINDKALRDRQETVCRQMIISLGKIILNSSRFDLSMVSFPVHFLTKFGLKAQQHHFEEVTVLTTSTLLEVAKAILNDVNTTYAELQDPFQSIINGLAAIARGTFKKKKETSIKVLVQPLIDLKTQLLSDKISQYKDSPYLVEQINNLLDEFLVLEQVMQSIPPIPDMGET